MAGVNHEAWARNMITFIRERGLEEEFKDWSGGWPCPIEDQPGGVLYGTVEHVINWLRSTPLESGICCCGDPVKGHNLGSGHAPVDDFAYAACRLEDELRAALAQARGEVSVHTLEGGL